MNQHMKRLLERAAVFDQAEPTSRRREELIERAEAAGILADHANRIYDLAEEEGVDPAAAFELVLCGVGVRELAPPTRDQWEETQVEAPPDWVHDVAPAAEDAVRERLVRTSFRRLRSLIERSGSAPDALREFVHQPDVDTVEY